MFTELEYVNISYLGIMNFINYVCHMRENRSGIRCFTKQLTNIFKISKTSLGTFE